MNRAGGKNLFPPSFRRTVLHGVDVKVNIDRLVGLYAEQRLAGGQQCASHGLRRGRGLHLEQEVADVEQLDAAHERAVGAQQVLLEVWAQYGGQGLGGGLHLALVAVFEIDADEARKGRIAEELALVELLVVEPLVVVLYDLPDDGQLGLACLQHHQAAALAASGTTGHLREHLERALVGAEVGARERLVGIDDAHHAHAVEVEPLGHHLRADEYVSLAALELPDDLVVGGAGAGGVKVKARRAGLGQEGMYGLFNPKDPYADFFLIIHIHGQYRIAIVLILINDMIHISLNRFQISVPQT